MPSPVETATPLAEQLTSDELEDITAKIGEIGYLKTLGLEFGWGPTSIVQWILEHIHVYLGTPWWGSITLAAVAIRAIMVYPLLQTSEHSARLAKVSPQLNVAREEYSRLLADGDKTAAQLAGAKIHKIRKQSGAKMAWLFAPAALQMFFGFGAFKLLRIMSQLPVPGFEDGGFLWLKDLTMSDPYLVLPVAMAGILHLSARVCHAPDVR